jgi:hypothetical protein
VRRLNEPAHFLCGDAERSTGGTTSFLLSNYPML